MSDASENNKVKEIGGKKFVKKIFQVTNELGNKLSCMMYEPIAEERPAEKMPVLIYMHGNAGCRLEAEAYVPKLLSHGINVCAFDFSGCGHSEGEYVTLGWKERGDLNSVINHLNSSGSVSKIGLWGRSMGAATSIMYLAENVDKAHAVVLDSGFAALTDVINQLGAMMMQIPPPFMTMLTMSIQ
jgi:pimeloyl-ACP methyl ester carboxylesterase